MHCYRSQDHLLQAAFLSLSTTHPPQWVQWAYSPADWRGQKQLCHCHWYPSDLMRPDTWWRLMSVELNVQMNVWTSHFGIPAIIHNNSLRAFISQTI